MMLDYMWELQKIIHQNLNDNQKVKNFVTGIYTKVPQDTVFPYLVISFDDIREDSSFTEDGYNISLSVKILSRDSGLGNLFKLANIVENVILDMEFKHPKINLSKIVFLGIDFSHLKDGHTQTMNLKFNMTLRGVYNEAK